jgi:HSP20 family protein
MRMPALRRSRRAAARPYSPWSFSALAEPFTSLHAQIDQVFDEFAHNSVWNDGHNISFAFPVIDLTEKDGSVMLSAELPGLDDSDLEVSVRGDRLTIKGEKKFVHDDKDETRHIVERSYGKFERNISLGFEPDPDQIQAETSKGVLHVMIPKPASVDAEAKRIKIAQKR